MKLIIRQAKTEDLAFLLELENSSFPQYQRNTKTSLANSIKSHFQEVLVVEEQELKKRRGAAVLFKYRNTLRLYSIATDPDFQNKGVGSFLMAYIKNYAENKGFEKIVLEAAINNHELLAWYRGLGFVQKQVLKDYYAPGFDALKMELLIESPVRNKGLDNLVVIDQPYKWNRPDINARIISVKEYLSNTTYQSGDFRVFNLCSSYKYQTYGYYVSLLASARGQRVMPNIATIRDFRIMNVIQSAAFELDEMINRALNKSKETVFSLNIYFGQSPNKGYKLLATKLFQLFEAPLFRVKFVKHDKWLIKSIRTLTFKSIPGAEEEQLYQFAAEYFRRKRYNFPKLTNYKYDLAVLVNPQEMNPPSNEAALQRIKSAANKKSIYVEFITKNDVEKINEFDALFIRETTQVNHHTYEISRLAYSEGLVVLDDPWSILRCSNKIYQDELFKKHRIRTPKTFALSRNMFHDKQLDKFNYPLVIKQPDSAFSLGVKKVNNKEEALLEMKKLFKISDMLVCQEFLYSDFDWRVGILDNKPLFVCKYYMSNNHWQIYNWNSKKEDDQAGKSETLSIDDAPPDVLKVAQKAASLIGDGLYGVDLKVVDSKIYVVEVNDNPNIDHGIEDLVLQDELYDKLIDSFVQRIELAKNIRKINFTTPGHGFREDHDGKPFNIRDAK